MLTLRNHQKVRKPITGQQGAGILGVVWLNGRLELAWDTSRADGIWSAGDPVTDLPAFGRALEQAVADLGRQGSKASLLLAHPQLLQIPVEVPPGPPSIHRRILAREVDRQKPFTESAVWMDLPLGDLKEQQRRWVHFLPTTLRDQICLQFRRLGLTLESLVPIPLAVLPVGHGVRSEEMGTVLEVACIPSGLMLAAIRGRTTLLCRMLPPNAADPDRVVQEIRRTSGFFREQIQVELRHVRVSGPSDRVGPIEARLADSGMVVETVSWNDGYWLDWIRSNAGGPPLDLLRAGGSELPESMGIQRETKRLVGLVLMGAFLSGGWMEFESLRESRRIRELVDIRSRLEAELAEGLEQLACLQHQAGWIRSWLEAERPPIPLWLPTHLSEVLPSELVLTNLDVQAKGRGWSISIEGTASHPVGSLDPRAVSLLNDRLRDGPWWGEPELESGITPPPVRSGEPRLNWGDHLAPVHGTGRNRNSEGFQIHWRIP